MQSVKKSGQARAFFVNIKPATGGTESFWDRTHKIKLMKSNPELSLAWDFVENTHRNIFLSGKAGTGKTTFLHKVREESFKRLVVVAPTGVAAINAKGVTIHSFFQMPFGPILPGKALERDPKSGYKRKFSKKKIELIRSLDLLIIDEISMVRADLLDGIDEVLRKYKDRDRVFGGVQVLMIGDLQQLAPVIKDNEWSLLQAHYDTPYFFSSKAFQASGAVGIELKTIFRQQNEEFIAILNEIRNDRISDASLAKLNGRYIPDFVAKDDEGYIMLTTHNYQADNINRQKLDQLSSPAYRYEAEVEGDFSEYAYPTHYELVLKTGAQVMFIKNDSSYEKRYYNGKIGTVVALDEDTVSVQCPGDDAPVVTGYERWENITYTIDPETQKITEKLKGSFSQIPLRLAWAITIHKSQGLTFDKVIIDVSSSFAHGQTYVALSRCKTLDGIVLRKPVERRSIIQDRRVSGFTREMEEKKPDEKTLREAQKDFHLLLIKELFNYEKLLYPALRFLKVSRQNYTGVQGRYKDEIQTIITSINNLIKVGKNFHHQLITLSQKTNIPEEDPVVQERISKAIEYFKKQNEEVFMENIGKIKFSTDNKAVRKDLKKALKELNKELQIKRYCMEGLDGQFSIEKYMHLRAVAALEDFAIPVIDEDLRDESPHPELFESLREWRMQTALKNNIPPYSVFTQVSLFELCNSLPGNLSQLKSIHGLGKVRIARYGEEIIKIIRDYCERNHIDVNDEIVIEKKKEKKENTKEITLRHFKAGLSIPEIAQERGLVNSTIENHLAHYIREGVLRLEEVIGAEKARQLRQDVQQAKQSNIADLKAKFQEKYSYGELRMALASLTNNDVDKS